MASVTYGKYVFGLRDIKITNLAGTTQEDLDTAMMAEFSPEFSTGRAEGDDSVKAAVSYLRGGKLTFSGGAISSAALAIITGKSLATSGSTPNEITELQLDGGDAMPYFKVYAQALDEGSGDIHLLFYKVKLFGGMQLSLQDAQFHTQGFECEVLSDSTHGLIEVIQHETSAAVPSS